MHVFNSDCNSAAQLDPPLPHNATLQPAVLLPNSLHAGSRDNKSDAQHRRASRPRPKSLALQALAEHHRPQQQQYMANIINDPTRQRFVPRALTPVEHPFMGDFLPFRSCNNEALPPVSARGRSSQTRDQPNHDTDVTRYAIVVTADGRRAMRPVSAEIASTTQTFVLVDSNAHGNRFAPVPAINSQVMQRTQPMPHAQPTHHLQPMYHPHPTHHPQPRGRPQPMQRTQPLHQAKAVKPAQAQGDNESSTLDPVRNPNWAGDYNCYLDAILAHDVKKQAREPVGVDQIPQIPTIIVDSPRTETKVVDLREETAVVDLTGEDDVDDVSMEDTAHNPDLLAVPKVNERGLIKQKKAEPRRHGMMRDSIKRTFGQYSFT